MEIPVSVMRGSRRELDVDLRPVEGAIPKSLQGHLFVAAPLPWGDGSPVFNGDAMAMRVDFADQGARLKSRVLRDPSQRVDEATRNDPVLRFRNRAIARISPVLGVRNELNTAWLHMPADDRLFATYDAGRPWEVDPTTLEVVTPVGRLEEWEAAFAVDLPWLFPPVLTGAHPAHDDRTGETFFANYSLGAVVTGAHVRLLRWDGEGPLAAFRVLDERGRDLNVQSLHQFAITERWVVLVDTAFRLELGRFLSPNHWPLIRQRPYTSIYLVDREQLTGPGGQVRAKRVVIPRETVHFVADHACPDGQVTLHIGHPCASDASETLRTSDRRWDDGTRVRPELEGYPPSPTDIGMFGRYTIDAESAQVVSAALYHDEHTWGPALLTTTSNRVQDRHQHLWWLTGGLLRESLIARLVDAYENYPHRNVSTDAYPEHVAPELVRLDAPRAKVVDRFTFPDGMLPGSPQFVPAAAADGELDGFIICTVVGAGARRNSSGDEFWIFRAGQLSNGPVCKLGHPELDFAVTLHTAWMAELKPRSSSYRVPVSQEVEARMAKLPSVWPWSATRKVVRRYAWSTAQD